MLHDPAKKRLPPEKRVAEVVKIVGKEHRDSVAGIVTLLSELEREAADGRARERDEGQSDKRRAERFAAHLRRIEDILNQSRWREWPEARSRIDVLKGMSEGEGVAHERMREGRRKAEGPARDRQSFVR